MVGTKFDEPIKEESPSKRELWEAWALPLIAMVASALIVIGLIAFAKRFLLLAQSII